MLRCLVCLFTVAVLVNAAPTVDNDDLDDSYEVMSKRWENSYDCMPRPLCYRVDIYRCCQQNDAWPF
ncbi:hypothetical protein ACOMHN_008141 [Nucella lapillus]